MNIYSLKNEKLDFFNRPMFFESANECLSYLQNVLMSDADRALIGLKDDLCLYLLGSIDFTTGIIDPKGCPLKIFDVAEIFDTIPKERVPQTANQLRDKIVELSAELEEFKKEVSNVYKRKNKS